MTHLRIRRGLGEDLNRTHHWFLVLLAALLLPVAVHATPLSPDHECLGRWVGRGRNTGHTTYWTIELTLTASPSGGRCGTIRYTNPDCHGFLDNCRLVGNDIHTVENYTHQGGCAPPGHVIIRCEQNQMRYSWLGWERVDTLLVRPAGAPVVQQPSSPASRGTNPLAPSPSLSPAQPAPPPPPPPMTPPAGGGATPAPTQPSTPPTSTSSESGWFGCSVVNEPSQERINVLWLAALLGSCLLVLRRRS